MKDDIIRKSTIRHARVTTVKDGIEQVIHYETDMDSIVDFKEKMTYIVKEHMNPDKIKKEIATEIYTNVDNELTKYALLDSPVFIGNPKVPTADSTSNDTTIASTKFVVTVSSNITDTKIAKALSTVGQDLKLTGNPTAPTASVNSNSTTVANTQFVTNKINSSLIPYATLDSPIFTGAPKSVTTSIDSNDTSIATTAFVKNALYTVQDLLVFDSTPTANSKNPVTSNGIYEAIKYSINNLATVARTGKYTDLLDKPTTGTETVEGLTKIYNTKGLNTDGTMSQKAIFDELDKKTDDSSLSIIAKTGSMKDLTNIYQGTPNKFGMTKLYTEITDKNYTDGAPTVSAVFSYLKNNYMNINNSTAKSQIQINEPFKEDSYKLDPKDKVLNKPKSYDTNGGVTISGIYSIENNTNGGKNYNWWITKTNYIGTANKAIHDENGNSISSYYATKEEVSRIPKFEIIIVDDLPKKNISKTTIYLVKRKDPKGEDLYKEYIYTSQNKWEILGSQKLDLSGYYKKEEIDSSLSKKSNIDSPSFTGTPTSVNPDVSSNNNAIATTKFVNDVVRLKENVFITSTTDAPDNFKENDLWVQIID